jgi:hypothetical protein
VNEVLETISLEPPTTADLTGKLSQLLTLGRPIAGISAYELLGLDPSAEDLLRSQPESAPNWRFYLDELHQQLIVGERARTAMVHLRSLSGYSKANEVAGLFAQATAHLNRPVLLVTSAIRPEHPLLLDHAPENCLVVCCPIVGESSERISFGGFRLDVDALENAPQGWAPISIGRRVLGWAEPNGRAIRLRFHPFIRNGRLTTSRAPQRVELLQSLLGMAIATETPSAGVDEQAIEVWRSRLVFAEGLLAAVAGSQPELQARLSVHEREASQARTRVDRLVEELCVALQEEERARQQLNALSPQLQQRQAQRTMALGETLARIEALPQVASVSLGARTLSVQIEGLTFEMALSPRSGEQLVRVVSGGHRLVRPDRSLELGESFLPLANVIAGGNLVAAVQLVLGALNS